VGLIGGLIGAIGGGLAIYDRWTAPDLDIWGAAPVAVRCIMSRDPNVYAYGVSLIAHVQNNGPKRAYVGGADITGKVYLSAFTAWSLLSRFEDFGTQTEVESRKPYVQIAWSGWPTDHNGPYSIEPNEERFLKFTFVEPHSSGRSFVLNAPTKDYIGFDDGTKQQRLSRQPEIQFLFAEGDRRSFRYLRDEVKEGILRLHLRVGSDSMPVLPSKLTSRTIGESRWEEASPRLVYFDDEF